jgi:hypothetical protein
MWKNPIQLAAYAAYANAITQTNNSGLQAIHNRREERMALCLTAK